jgi:peptide-methionine (S)-S-oxide reductase
LLSVLALSACTAEPTALVPAYSGSPAYELVSSGDTGHAEPVQVTIDPRQICYAQILQIFFSVAHDPTQMNRQGPDRGTPYRSAIFPLNRARVFPAAIATIIEPGVSFYPAEAYHQDYLYLNPGQPYIVNDLPKIEQLQKVFPAQYRSQSVLFNAR